MSASAAASSQPDGANQRDSYIPVFSGQPADYKEWRKRIQLYYRKMVMQKRTGEANLNIIASMQGTAWKLLEDYPLDDVEKKDCFDGILKILDKHFEYDSRVQLPTDFDKYFGLQRKQGQTMLAYVTEHTDLHRKLEKHGVSLPTTVQGWHLLRAAGLTREQKQLITLKAPQLELNKVTEALFLLLGQDYKDVRGHGQERRHFHKGKGGGYRAYAADEMSAVSEDWSPSSSVTHAAGFEAYYGYEHGDDQSEPYTMVDYDFDPVMDGVVEFDGDAAYYEDEPEDAEAAAGYDVNAFDHAYATYLDARKRFTDLKLQLVPPVKSHRNLAVIY